MAARLTTYIVVAIVAATLIAGLIVGAQRDDSSGPVDLIVHNAAVYTADGGDPTAEAVAVRGNQILRVGSEREIMRLRRPQTLVIDAGGGAVLPGFNDVHAHPIDAGLALEGVDLLDAASVEEMQDRIAAWAGTHPEELWIRGRGWTYDAFDENGPTRQQLDRIVRDRPVRLLSADGRDAWVNTKALQLAGIARDGRNGDGTGLLRGSATERVERLVPAPTRAERARALRTAIARAHEYGVTSLQLIGGSVQDVELFDEALRDRAWAMRIYSALTVRPPLDAATADALDAIWKQHGDDPLFKTGAISVTLDGPIDTGDAALLDPYAGRGDGRGEPRLTPAQLQRIVMSMDARGWQVMIDANGDRAVRMALDAFQAAVEANDRPARGRRHRIEVELVDPQDVPRFDALGIIAAMQPYAATREMAPLGWWSRQLGADRAARGWAAATLASAGAKLAFGSGWPAGPIDPMLALHAAVTRTRPDGTPEGGWHPEERLTLEAAINAYTSAAAWASFDEHRKGMIKPGMLADIVVLDRNIFEEPPSALASTTVDFTIFDGKVVYRRDKHRDTE